MKGLHILWGGPDRIIVDANGKEWLFEAHPRFGPLVLNKDRSVAAAQPGERSPFWKAWGHWHEQGEQLDGAANDTPRCVWAEPPPRPPLVHLGGRNYAEAGGALAIKYGKKP